MSNPYQNSSNLSQIDPAILQAMSTIQPQGALAPGGNIPAFQTFHQAFQRLQSHESQKQDQQRLGLGGMPPAQSASQQQQQQNFLQMMQNSGMLANPSNDPAIANFNLTMAQQAQAGQQMQQGQNQQMQMNLGNMGNLGNLANMGNMGQNGGLNIHSQQQGLNLSAMPEVEEGRRQMLQK